MKVEYRPDRNSYIFGNFQDGDPSDFSERARLMRHARKCPGVVIVGKRSTADDGEYVPRRKRT